MISNRCARKSLVTNCNSIISKNYLRFLVDSNGLLYELDSMLNKLENKYSIEYLLDIWSKDDTDLQYPFLLAKNNPKRLDEWTDKMKFEIQKLDAKLLELSSEKSEQEKRDDCLDKEMKLDGIRMKINRLVSSRKNILETLNFIQSNANKVEKTT